MFKSVAPERHLWSCGNAWMSDNWTCVKLWDGGGDFVSLFVAMRFSLEAVQRKSNSR